MTAWQRFAEWALTLLYPSTCVLCGAPGDAERDLCTGCRADLPLIGPHCPRCAQPFSGPQHQTGVSVSDTSGVCGRCQREPPPFERCTTAFRYEDPLPALVSGIKFQSKLNLIRLLGELLADAVQASLEHASQPLPEAIVPVPLHPRRLSTRGYNQALELARVVSRRLVIPVNSSCCQRRRATHAQSELDERLRFTNIRDAFAVTSAVPRRVAILDDVVTTGATVSELARVLNRAGCEQCEIWALARTP